MLGKLIDGHLRIASGNVLIIDDEVIVNPREEDWKRAGYKEVKDNRLPEKEGYYKVPVYSEDYEYIFIIYHYEEIPDDEETVA